MTFKVGDLIRYFDGDLGLITGFDKEKDPIVFWFREKTHATCFKRNITLLSRNEQKSSKRTLNDKLPLEAKGAKDDICKRL